MYSLFRGNGKELVERKGIGRGEDKFREDREDKIDEIKKFFYAD